VFYVLVTMTGLFVFISQFRPILLLLLLLFAALWFSFCGQKMFIELLPEINKNNLYVAINIHLLMVTYYSRKVQTYDTL